MLHPASEQLTRLRLRLIVSASSALITLALLAALLQVRERRHVWRITPAALLCAPAAFAFGAVNAVVYRHSPDCSRLAPAPGLRVVTDPWCQEGWGEMIVDHAFDGYLLMATWAALYLLLGYTAEVGRCERQAAVLRAAAQTAELRALRYQVNPHFLFNTLNSLSTMVMARRTGDAEVTILELSTYFRASLNFDPTSDVTLGDENELQRLYLTIEERRFPRRMRTEIALPPELADARVPGMLLQPLVENAVKHGVARSRGLVTVQVTAREEGGRLRVDVIDDAVTAGAPAPGTGVGLRNVTDRLRARHGEDSAYQCGAEPGGGFRASLDLPLVRS